MRRAFSLLEMSKSSLRQQHGFGWNVKQFKAIFLLILRYKANVEWNEPNRMLNSTNLITNGKNRIVAEFRETIPLNASLQPTTRVYYSRAATQRKHGRPNSFCRYNNTFLVNTRKHKYTIWTKKNQWHVSISWKNEFISNKESKENRAIVRLHRKSEKINPVRLIDPYGVQTKNHFKSIATNFWISFH